MTPSRHFLQRAHGIALVSAMLILVMLTLLALSMFRGFGLQQKIAGNVLEKSRAFEAAQNALQYGEYWLMNTTATLTSVTCTSTMTITSDADMRVCDTVLATPANPGSWGGGSTYTPPGMQVNSGGGAIVNANNDGDINYASAPALHIAYLGSAGCVTFYQVTGAGYGGSKSSAAVVQSVISIQPPGGVCGLAGM